MCQRTVPCHRRKGDEVYYFAERRECDFIVKDDRGKLSSYQVTLELKEENKEREIAGLIEAYTYLLFRYASLLCRT